MLWTTGGDIHTDRTFLKSWCGVRYIDIDQTKSSLTEIHLGSCLTLDLSGASVGGVFDLLSNKWFRLL
jgi:hypothetical protein